MAAESAGQESLRAENVDRLIKGLAAAKYTAKQAVMIDSSSAQKESYFQETKTVPTAGTTASIKDVPRLSPFPKANITWTKKSAYVQKYGLEDVLSYEDALLDSFDVISRTILRVTEGVVKSVDDEILSVLSESWTAATINTVAIGAGSEWDAAVIANRDPIQNILDAQAEVEIDNYMDGRTLLYINPTDAAKIMGNSNVRNAGQFFSDSVTRNGELGKFAFGVTVIKTNSVPADSALMVKEKICGTWKEVTPLTTFSITQEGISYTIRAMELGVTQLTNPEAVCLISNTRA